MPRKAIYKDPVRFSVQMERELLEKIDKVAATYQVERNRLINRLLEKNKDAFKNKTSSQNTILELADKLTLPVLSIIATPPILRAMFNLYLLSTCSFNSFIASINKPIILP